MKNIRFQASLCSIVSLVLCGAASHAKGAVLFEDHFDSGALSPQWASRAPNQWIQDGWLYEQDRDGWPRDALTVVHDSDASWSNYTVSVLGQFLPGSWQHMNLVLRSNGFYRTSAGSGGSAYQLELTGSGFGQPDMVTLTRTTAAGSTTLAQVAFALPDDPMQIVATVDHDRIWASINGQLIFSLIDPNPLQFGGVGLHTIWESSARWDNFQVNGIPATVPEPDVLALLLAGGLSSLLPGRRGQRG